MKRNLLALLLTLLLALALPLTALGEGGEPVYIKIDESTPPDIVTRIVYQIGGETAPEEFLRVGIIDASGYPLHQWLQQEGEDFTFYTSAEKPVVFATVNNFTANFPNVREVSFNGAFDVSRVTSLSGMFKGCSKLERIDFTGFQNNGGEPMDEMFSGCASLTFLDLRSFRILPTASMTGVFAGCKSLALVLVSGDTDPAAIAKLEAEMGDCAVHTVTVDFSRSTGGSAAEAAPVYATLLEVAGAKPDAFICVHFLPSTQGAPAGNEIDMSVWGLFTPEQKGTSWVEKQADGYVVYFASDEPFRVEKYCSGLFSGFSGLREIDFNGCIDGSNVVNASYAFSGCSSLTSIDLSDFGAESILNMSGMFEGCSSLTSVDLSGAHITPGTNLSGIFAGCTSLTEVFVNQDTHPNVIGVLKAEMAGCAGQTVTVK